MPHPPPHPFAGMGGSRHHQIDQPEKCLLGDRKPGPFVAPWKVMGTFLPFLDFVLGRRERHRIASDDRIQQRRMCVSKYAGQVELADLRLGHWSSEHVASDTCRALQRKGAVAGLDVSQQFALLHHQGAGALARDHVPSIAWCRSGTLQPNMTKATERARGQKRDRSSRRPRASRART